MKDKNGVTLFGTDEAEFIYSEFVEIIKEANKDTIDQSNFITQLKTFLSDEYFTKILDIGDSFYRARCVSHKNCRDESKGFEIKGDYLCGFNEKESGAPPRKESVVPPQEEKLNGRCDIDNIIILYVANDIETACCEVRPLFTEIISVATYTVMRPLKLFNITHDIPTRNEYLSIEEGMKETYMQSIWSNFVKIFAREYREAKYKISQIISQFIYSYGFDGIIYNSSQSNGLNYAIFNPTDESIQWMGSQLYICTHKQICFNSFNDQQPLRPIKKNLDTTEAQEIKRNTIQYVVEERTKDRNS